MTKPRPLTRRQQDVLERFLDLYRKAEQPLHYSEVAAHLGIRPVTAYEMLRLLEDRGLVASEYRLDERGGGPGRAAVYFRPTPRAHELIRDLAGGHSLEGEDWEKTRAYLLEQVRTRSPDEVLEEVLVRVMDEDRPLVYLAEMVAGILLALEETLASLHHDAEWRERLSAFGIPAELGAQALVGLSMGLALTGRLNRRITSFLLTHTHRFREQLAQLGEAESRHLDRFVKDVCQALWVKRSS